MLPWLLLALAAAPQTLKDDFAAYPAGSDGSPAWLPETVAAEVADGGYVVGGGAAVWQAVPYAGALSFACDVTPLAETAGDEGWCTCGIGLYFDPANYWQMNLVRAPAANQKRHYTELQECLKGAWLAQTQVGTLVPRTVVEGGEFNWEMGRTYRFELELTPERLEGRILDGGQVKARHVYDLTAAVPLLRTGRPALRANGLRVRFDNAEVTVTATATEPVARRVEAPAWVSRAAPAVAEGTGYFATARVDGRWWLVDPEGKAFFDVGTDHVNYDAHWCEKLGYAPYHRNVERKFGGAEAWAVSATDRLRQWGFNTLAAGHYANTEHKGLPHINFASFGSSFAPLEWICEPIHWTGFPNVFSPRWPRHCQIVARRFARINGDDPWVIGTFLDNELEWYGKHGRLVDEIYALNPDNPAKQALWDWLLAVYKSVAAINAVLGSHYADAAAFMNSTTAPPGSERYAEVSDGFLAVIAEKYFSAACTALKEADPHHLVMGCRFAGQAPVPALASAGKYNDVFTINTYPRVDMERGVVEGVPRQFTEYYQVVDRPFIITEWSFPALDSGLPCTAGAGMRVDTQAQKARCYQVFAETMADLPFVVGYHYFMWADEPALGISSTFPEDSNYGLVNEQDEPYAAFVPTVTKVNQAVFARHARSGMVADLQASVRNGAVVVRNAGQAEGTGAIWVRGTGATGKPVELRLKPGEERRLAVKQDGWTTVSLRHADSTWSSILRSPHAVANLGPAITRPVPVLFTEPFPYLVHGSKLPSGDVWMPAIPKDDTRSVPGFQLTGGGTTWVCEKKTGALFETVAADGLPLGEVIFACHQIINGQHQWVSSDKVESLTLREDGAGWTVRAVVAFTGGGKPITAVDDAGQQAAQRAEPARYRAELVAAVLRDHPAALAKPLRVESTDTRAWSLEDVFVFSRPAIGGSTVDDVASGKDVPNYYLPSHFWTDQKLGGAFGAWGGEDWPTNYWKDPGGLFHPDARHPVNLAMTKGKRWEAGELSCLWLYGTKDASGWTDITQLAQAASNLRPR
ncbi:MAG: hypothetical protein HYU66_28175 [Armatimonadetes bacterium]|nr:hypothetical protein [Armatimonadota bacterium]